MRKATAAVVLVALLMAVGGGAAAAQTPITSCSDFGNGNIQTGESGAYELTGDIDQSSQNDCIKINTNDVVIEGNGFRINSTVGGIEGIEMRPILGANKVSNITIRNLSISNYDEGVAVQDGEDIVLTNVKTASTKTGVSVENGTDVTVEGATISSTDVGVKSNESVNVTVRDSFITSTFLLSLPLPIPNPNPFPTLGTQSHDSETGVLFNNTLDGRAVNNTITNFQGPGVEVLSSEPFLLVPGPILPPFPTLSTEEVTPEQSSFNEVAGNRVRNNTYGISFEDSFGYDIVDNTVINSSDEGIVLSNSTVSVTDNKVNESGSHGIWLTEGSDFNDLTDNVAEDNDRAGIYLGGVLLPTNPAENNTLVNNTARRNDFGIWIRNSFDNDVSESLVENNTEGITVEEQQQTTFSGGVETETVEETGNTFTDDVSRNNDWDFVAYSGSSGGLTPYSAGVSNLPVTNLSIGASTAPDTTLSFEANDVRLRSLDNPRSDPAGLENISRFFEAEEIDTSGIGPVQTGGTFLNVSLSYEDSDVSGVNESTLGLQRDVGTQWVPVPDSEVNTSENLISVNITTFSDFGAFGESQEPANFEVSDLSAPSEVNTSESVTVNATVENTGGETGEQNVTFRINATGEPLNEASVAATEQNLNLAPGQNQTVEFNVNAPSAEGDYDHGIFSENDSETAVLTVNDTASVTLPPGFPSFNGAENVFDELDSNDDGNVSPGEMSRAVGEFLNSQTIGGIPVSPGEMSRIVGWFLGR